MLLNIRAREITDLRRRKRELTALLADMEKNAYANDKILLTLHRLALLLIGKPANWQPQAETLLKKGLSLPYCRLMVFSRRDAALAAACARLPAGGRAANEALAGTAACRGAKRYFHLPLKNGRRAIGVLIFASKKADAFPDEAARDFSLRLAELLSAAL